MLDKSRFHKINNSKEQNKRTKNSSCNYFGIYKGCLRTKKMS